MMNGTDIANFSTAISDIIWDTTNYEVEVLFYLTQHCNLKCDGCYMRSSPNTPQNTLPHNDIRFYLNEFDEMPNFTHMVTFSGGEIFTTPINYLEGCAHTVLDRGYGLQLKTNGAWIQNPQTCESVKNMLGRLNPRRGLVATGAQIQAFLAGKPRWLLRILGRDIVCAWMKKALPTQTMLSMAISVDDFLHPAKTADWFIQIADMITNNTRLRDKVALKTFTLNKSVPFLETHVLNNPNLNVQNFQQMPRRRAAKYTVNGATIESYVGDYVDVGAVPQIKKLSEITVPPLGDARGRLVYCFYPDGTAGFDCNYLESVGRVPYRDENGKCKPLTQLQHDIHKKLVTDYIHAIR